MEGLQEAPRPNNTISPAVVTAIRLIVGLISGTCHYCAPSFLSKVRGRSGASHTSSVPLRQRQRRLPSLVLGIEGRAPVDQQLNDW